MSEIVQRLNQPMKSFDLFGNPALVQRLNQPMKPFEIFGNPALCSKCNYSHRLKILYN